MEWSHRAPSLLQSCFLESALQFTVKKVWISALLATYCILLKDLHMHINLPENKQMLYQFSFPKPATVWLDTNNPTFLRVLLHCWERTKPSATKTLRKLNRIFLQPCTTPVFSDTSNFSWFTKISQVFCHSTINCFWPIFFFLPSRPQSAASLDCNFAL